MHLVDILGLRQVPAAGLYLSLTRRCPLSCAHCSTNSSLSSEEYDGDVFQQWVDSFTPECHPDLIVMTGGEPLLRPRLVRTLTDSAHAAGTKVVLASGMFFAREPKVPSLIAHAIADIDHFTVSLDIFHEQQVPRAGVFRVIHEFIERGKDASFLVTGLNEEDPYLLALIDDIRQTFDDRVPVLAAVVKPVGRAQKWMDGHAPMREADLGPMPCDLAAWPVITYDGTAVACCNQHVIDGPPPPHLRLGHASTDGWASLRERYLRSSMLRAIRVFGPEHIARRYSEGKIGCDGYCSTCYRLSDDPETAQRIEPVMARPTMALIEEQVIRLQQDNFIARHGPAAFAHLAHLGAPQPAAAVSA